MTSLTTRALLKLSLKDFRKYLRELPEPPSYNTLKRYRKAIIQAIPATSAATTTTETQTEGSTPTEFVELELKLKKIESLMRECVKNGEKVKRRKSGTGEKKEIELEYKDTPSNRKLNRVGQKYKKIVYEGAEIEETPRRMLKRRRITTSTGEEPSPKRTNRWIKAVQQAKNELQAPSFLIIRREAKNPDDTNEALSVKVYQRAVEIMNAEKAIQTV